MRQNDIKILIKDISEINNNECYIEIFQFPGHAARPVGMDCAAPTTAGGRCPRLRRPPA